MLVDQNTWKVFKNQYTHTYRRYQTRNKSKAASHGYGAAGNNVQETEAQNIMADALQALTNVVIEDKVKMANLRSINLTLSQNLIQSQETILALSNKLQTLQFQMKTKKLATDKKKR